jgi:ATP-dependent protease ClpP protease subunit
MSLKYFKNQGGGKYELVLHGIIGLDVDGSAVAREIAALNEFAGATEIVERINSIGGSVVEGFSIASANLQSKAKITTICEGVCDSIAAVVFATGDSRKIMEFGSVMVHNVLLNGVTLEEIEDEKEKEDAQKINNSILNILTNKCGGDEEKIKRFMSAESRFNADEAVAEGFADEKILIGEGKQKPATMENFSPIEYMNICKEFSADKGQNINKNHKQMKTVLTFLNLNAEASEEAVLSAIKDMQNAAKGAKTLQETVNTLTAENKELKKAKAEQEVEGYINKGMFDASKKEELVNMCIEQPEAFKALSLMKPEYVNISETLKSGKKKEPKAGEPTEKELADEFVNMQKNDPAALEELERTDKAKFENMLNAYNNVD